VTKADPNGISQIGGDDTDMLVMGDYAIICPSEQYASLTAMAKAKGAKSIADVLVAQEKAGASTAPLWVRVDMVKINALYGRDMADQFEKLKSMPSAAMAGGAAGPTKAVGAYLDAALSIVKQSQTVNLSVTPKANAITLTTLLVATPGSEMAKTLALGPTPKGSPELTAYLKDGALANYYMRLNKPMVNKIYTSFFDLFAGGNGLSKQDIDKVKALIDKGTGSLGDAAAGSIMGAPGSKPPFALDYVVQVKDAKAMQEASNGAMDMFNNGPLGKVYKSMGVDMSMTRSPQPAQYNGFSIETTTVSVKAADPNSEEAHMLEMMYGGGFKTCDASGPGVSLVCIASDSEAAVRKLVDQYKAGGPKEGSSEFKAAMALVPDAANADVIVTYNYLRIFKSFSTLIPIPGIGDALAKLPESKSNLVVAARMANGTLSVDVVLPKQHAQEIMAAVNQVQAQMMQKNRGNGGPRSNRRSMPD